MLNLTKTHGFYPIFKSDSVSNSNDHMHTEVIQTKFKMGIGLGLSVRNIAADGVLSQNFKH